MFSKNTEVLEFMIKSLDGNVFQSKRNNKVFLKNSMIKYPFENDLFSLNTSDRERCLIDYLFNENSDLALSPNNLDEWFVGNFGAGMTDLYFRPYNEKIWKIKLSDLSMSWSERIPLPPQVDVVKGALGVSTEGYLHQLFYNYPLIGGYQSITDQWSKLINPEKLFLNTIVQSIEAKKDGLAVTTNFGTELFDQVISTSSITDLPNLIKNIPDKVLNAISALRINAINVVTLGYRGDFPEKYTAVYYADPSFLPNRVSSPSVFSPNNAPVGYFSLQAEITFPPGEDYLAFNDSYLIEHVHNGFVASGLVASSNPPIFENVQKFHNAYVVYTNDYKENVQFIRDWAESIGLIIHGRFGSFDYLNIDGCIEKSQTLASKLNGRFTELPKI